MMSDAHSVSVVKTASARAPSAMVERVARAIYASIELKKPWDAAPKWHEPCRREARAAIEAMREPSREMVGAMEEWAGWCAGYIEEGWSAAIDVALGARAEAIDPSAPNARHSFI